MNRREKLWKAINKTVNCRMKQKLVIADHGPEPTMNSTTNGQWTRPGTLIMDSAMETDHWTQSNLWGAFSNLQTDNNHGKIRITSSRDPHKTKPSIKNWNIFGSQNIDWNRHEWTLKMIDSVMAWKITFYTVWNCFSKYLNDHFRILQNQRSKM